MTLHDFMKHWGIAENPFQGEEARADVVFSRMMAGDDAQPTSNGSGAASAAPGAHHSDFDKILGDLSRPGPAVVFGEKGSGKTAIRMQIAARVRAYNARAGERRVLLVPYDDLNGVLTRFHERVGGKTPLESFQKLRQADHLDAILAAVVQRIVDALLADASAASGGEGVELPDEPRKSVRRLDEQSRRELLQLQAAYDRPDYAEWRTHALLRRLRVGGGLSAFVQRGLVLLGPVVLLAYYVYFFVVASDDFAGSRQLLTHTLYGLLIVYGLVLLKAWGWDTFVVRQLARRVKRQVRTSGRGFASYARSLALLPTDLRDAGGLPADDSDETRYAMLARVRRILGKLGYAGILVVIDRVDEPTLISGDTDRMRAVVWPLLNNKLLQHEGVGLKLLLPVELRHALFKESSSFFQEARLDKQSLIERLTWTGATLYDLCQARLRACLRPGAAELRAGGPPSLLDLFAEDVTRQDLVDALDQMHQPRDAFKFMYRCINEHCAGVTADQNAWRIPRHVLEMVKKQEADRVQQLHRGIRPA